MRIQMALLLIVLTLLSACAPIEAPPAMSSATADVGGALDMTNPASINCAEQGGSLTIELRLDGGEYGICTFADNRQCEEWAFFRGECPLGGVEVSGYVTDAGRFCAITGGQYTVTANSGQADEIGDCTLVGGAVCPADAYFGGACPTTE